jgi:hypothetical protein
LSHDIEDIVAVFDGRREIVDEVEGTEPGLAKEIATHFKVLLEDDRFVDAVYGHMPTDVTSQKRAEIIIGTISKIAGKE